MSNYTGTVEELLYLSSAPGTAKSSFTAEASINDVTGMGPVPVIPANFWLPNNNQAGRALKIKALVSLGSTGTPTFTPVLRLGTTQGSTSGPIIGTSPAALTTVSGAASLIEIDLLVQMITRGTNGANSTLRGVGQITSPGFAIPKQMLWGAASAGSGASPGTVGSYDAGADNYLSLNFACSASSASNVVTCQRLEVHGLN